MSESAVRRTRLVALLLATLALLVVRSAAQSLGAPVAPGHATPPLSGIAQPLDAPRFRSGVDVVVVDVCVKGRDGRFIPTLDTDDFLILENNVPQRVAFFSAEDRVPLAVTLLVDRSASMYGPKLERAKTAAAAFLRALRADDLVEVIAFNERANRLFPLGSDHSAAEQSIGALSALGATGLFEGVLVALRDLEHAQRSRATEYRNAIVILSDGEDNSSVVSFDDVLEDVRRSGTIVYSISLRVDERDRALPPLHELAQFAFDSGGRAVAVRTLDSLAATYEEIGAELRHLYRLGYLPTPTVRDGRWHPISVRVPAKDARVRARAGYYAPRPVGPRS